MKIKLFTFIGVIIAAQLLFANATAFAQQAFNCEWLNYQDTVACSGTITEEKGIPSCDTGTPSEDYLKYSKYNLIVITESPFSTGSPYAGFSNICARQTICKSYVPAVSTPETSTTTPAGATPPPAAPETTTPPTREQFCYTKYVSPGECKATRDKNADPKTSCEFVQVYTASNGPQLLYGFVGVIYRYFAMLGGLIAVFVMIVGGIMIAAAGGSSERVTKAKTMIVRSLTGLIVLFLSALFLYALNPNFFTIS